MKAYLSDSNGSNLNDAANVAVEVKVITKYFWNTSRMPAGFDTWTHHTFYIV